MEIIKRNGNDMIKTIYEIVVAMIQLRRYGNSVSKIREYKKIKNANVYKFMARIVMM